MDNEIVKHLLDIGFKISTDGYIDSENRSHTYPILCMYFQKNDDDYELWINYSKNGFSLHGMDFQKEIRIQNISEIDTLVNILLGN